MKRVKTLIRESFWMPNTNKINIVLEDFIEKSILPLVQPKKTLFVHTHYWQNDIKGWAKDTPLCFAYNKAYNAYDFIESFYIFFLLRRKKMRQRTQKIFSITSFLFRDLPQKVQFSWQKIPINQAKRRKSLVNIQMLSSKNSIVKSIHINVPLLNLTEWKGYFIQAPRIKNLLNSLKNLIEENIKKAKKRNTPFFFLPSVEFNQLISKGLEWEKIETLSENFYHALTGSDLLKKLSDDLTEVFQKHSILRRWRVEKEDLNNFATVAIAHNLLPSWQYWYALPATTYLNKKVIGLGGIYICSTEEISQTNLGLINVAINLRYRLLGANYYSTYREEEK
jgi:hypothetical protein